MSFGPTVMGLTQPAHLQRLEKRDLAPDERDATRAEFIRRQLGLN